MLRRFGVLNHTRRHRNEGNGRCRFLGGLPVDRRRPDARAGAVEVGRARGPGRKNRAFTIHIAKGEDVLLLAGRMIQVGWAPSDITTCQRNTL